MGIGHEELDLFTEYMRVVIVGREALFFCVKMGWLRCDKSVCYEEGKTTWYVCWRWLFQSEDV